VERFLVYAVVICGALLLSSYATKFMVKRQFSSGVRKFTVSTIGVAAMALIWVILGYLQQ